MVYRNSIKVKSKEIDTYSCLCELKVDLAILVGLVVSIVRISVISVSFLNDFDGHLIDSEFSSDILRTFMRRLFDVLLY